MQLIISENTRNLLIRNPALRIDLLHALADLEHFEEFQVFHRLDAFGIFVYGQPLLLGLTRDKGIDLYWSLGVEAGLAIMPNVVVLVVSGGRRKIGDTGTKVLIWLHSIWIALTYVLVRRIFEHTIVLGYFGLLS